MAGWSDWYSGSMAPPLALPGGGYAPAPAVQAPMSVEELYRGIYGSSAPSLSSVSRPTVPINPQTGMPYMTTASARGGAGVGHGYAVSGEATYAAPRAPSLANPVRDLGAPQYGVPGAGGGVLTKSGLPPGATVQKTYTDPLVPKALVSGSARGSASLGSGGFGSGSLTIPRLPAKASDGIIDLSTLDLSDRGAQNTADSEGKPVRTKTGVYYPGGKGPVAASGGGAPRAAAAAPARSGGLFGSLFGGGNSGGLFGGGSGRAPVAITVTGGNPAPASPGATYATTPFQEDRFQTTTGAGMPSSMNNSRWTTGY